MDYFEVPRPSKEGFCSDKNCPCHDTVILPGEGYLYISQKLIDFRRDCFTYAKLQLKLKQMAESDPLNKLGAGSFVRFLPQGTTSPIMMCKQAAMLRSLDLEVARTDAKYWWKTGLVPFKVTPLAGGGLKNSIYVELSGAARKETKVDPSAFKGKIYRNRKYAFSLNLSEGWMAERKFLDFLHNPKETTFNYKKENLSLSLHVCVTPVDKKTIFNKEHEEHSLLKTLEKTVSQMERKSPPFLLIDKTVDGEKNTVWGEFHSTSIDNSIELFGIIHVLHNGLYYIIKYFGDLALENEVKKILSTFHF